MRFSLEVSPSRGYLLIAAVGHMDLGDMLGLFDLAGRLCETNGHRRMLVNLLDVKPHLTFTEHLHLGAHAGSCLQRLQRVATVATEMNRPGTSEKAAQKAGLDLRTFSELDQATVWVQRGGSANVAEWPGGAMDPDVSAQND
jgi:hypothetical protein